MNIYLANSLTHVPRDIFSEYVGFIHRLANEINTHKVKYALINSDPQLSDKPYFERAKLCYLWDRKMVEESDLIIAEATYPSIGLGIELQLAEAKNVPVILLFRDSEKNKAIPFQYENPDHSKHDLQIGEGFVSLMALGLPNVFRIIKYRNEDECITFTKDTIELLNTEG